MAIPRVSARGAGRLLLVLAPLLPGCDRPLPPQIVIEPEPSVEALLTTLHQGGNAFREVSFARLVELSTGRLVLPMDPEQPADAAILEGIAEVMDRLLEQFNAPDSVTHQASRINEVSAYFEEALLEALDRLPELECSLPRTAQGRLQRAGYPDLLIRHPDSGRVCYLDPKLVQAGTLDSKLRSFYFSPSTDHPKVRHDASHLLVGIEHDGNTGKWRYLRWHLVDLAGFTVRLKAEFQASNQEIYRPERILRQGGLP